MNLRIEITTTGGGKLDSTTSDHATVQDCVTAMQRAISAPYGTLNWVNPDGTTHVLNIRHVVAVVVSEARP